MGTSCRAVLFMATYWSCSVGLLYKLSWTMNIPAVQLANTAFTRLSPSLGRRVGCTRPRILRTLMITAHPCNSQLNLEKHACAVHIQLPYVLSDYPILHDCSKFATRMHEHGCSEFATAVPRSPSVSISLQRRSHWPCYAT